MNKEDENYYCPKCDAKLSEKDISKLRYLVFGVRPIKCNNCKSSIQWSKNVRNKLVCLGIITNIGIIMGIYSFLGWLGYVPRIGVHDHMIGTTIILIGITSTISVTKNKSIELVNET